MSARNSLDNPCRGRAFTQRRRVGPWRRGLSFPIHLYSVTDRVYKRLHIPVILLNNDPNNPRQTFVHPRGLFLFKSFVEHFYQSLTRNGSLSAVERPPQILRIKWLARKLRASHFPFLSSRLRPQDDPETLSLQPLRHPISLTVPG